MNKITITKLQYFFLIIMLSIFTLVGCFKEKEPEKEPEKSKKEKFYSIYSFATGIAVPDSLTDKYATWITETLRAAHNGLNTGDYEEPTEMIRVIKKEAMKIYSRSMEGLYKGYNNFIPYHKLAESEKDIFKKLRNETLEIKPQEN